MSAGLLAPGACVPEAAPLAKRPVRAEVISRDKHRRTGPLMFPSDDAELYDPAPPVVPPARSLKHFRAGVWAWTSLPRRPPARQLHTLGNRRPPTTDPPLREQREEPIELTYGAPRCGVGERIGRGSTTSAAALQGVLPLTNSWVGRPPVLGLVARSVPASGSHLPRSCVERPIPVRPLAGIWGRAAATVPGH